MCLQLDETRKELFFRENQVKQTEEKIANHRQEFLSKKSHAEQLSTELNEIHARCATAWSAVEQAENKLSQREKQMDALRRDAMQLEREVRDLKAAAAEQCTEQQYHSSKAALQGCSAELLPGQTFEKKSEELEAWIQELKRRIRNFRMHSNDDLEELKVKF